MVAEINTPSFSYSFYCFNIIYTYCDGIKISTVNDCNTSVI